MKSIFLPLVLIGAIILITFVGCDPDNNNHPGIEKPNIYIYPTKSTNISVSLNFPQGGEIVKSIPDYKSGWDITVTPDGLIDNQYSYLFYESNQPDVWQMEEGWLIRKNNLKDFFSKNMLAYGFEGQEILDFTDYWIPILSEYEFYAIYPQTRDIIDKVVQLKLSKSPDHLLRLFYKIEGFKTAPSIKLKKPIIKSFERNGFFITEWGVTFKR